MGRWSTTTRLWRPDLGARTVARSDRLSGSTGIAGCCGQDHGCSQRYRSYPAQSVTRINALVDEFCRRSEIAPKTRAFYRWNLERLLVPFCEREGLTQPQELTPDVIEQLAFEVDAYRKADGQPLARASRRAYMKALQQFLGWLKERHGVQGPDSRSVPVPLKQKIRRTVPSREEIQALEDAAPTERNKLIIRIMADTGAREGEVAGLFCDALVAKSGRYFYLEVAGKTGRRTVPISPQLHRRLVAYREGRTGRPRSRSPFLLLSRTAQPLTVTGVYQVVKDCVARAELERR